MTNAATVLARQYHQAGAAYAGQGLVHQALACFREAARLRPDDAAAHNNLGLMLAARGETAEALASYRRALALRPDYAEAWNNLGILHVRQRRPAEAVRCFRTAVGLRPDYVEALNNLGNVLFAQGRLGAAGRCYRQALHFRPDYGEAHLGLGVVYLHLRRRDQAVAAWRRSLALDARDARPHRNLAKVFYYQGHYDEALRSYRQVLALCPDDVEARVLVEALAGGAPERVPADYVARLYDELAGHYDRERSGRSPARLKEALGPPAAERALDVLDLGCGTGQAGQLFRDCARTLVGVDLSPAMLARARARGVYDELIEGDLAGLVPAGARAFDLVLASDSLIFLGDLRPVFRSVRQLLRPSGRFAFTVELHEGPGYRLLPAVHFAHSRGYLEEVAAETGLRVTVMERMVFRTVQGRDVAGLVVVLAR
jgi:predicted TPR repeat methyltransferase